MNLEKFLVRELPETIYYIPEIVSESEETLLIDRISKTPRTKWTQLRNRRLQNWGGMPTAKGMIPEAMPSWLDVLYKRSIKLGFMTTGVSTDFDNSTTIRLYGNDVIMKVMDVGSTAFGQVRPNHILLNEYLPGQGIIPHIDGDLFYPTIATVSLGSHTVLNYYRPLPKEKTEFLANDNIKSDDSTQLDSRLELSLLLEPRSLLLVKDAMYTDYLHGIEDKTADKLTERVIISSAKRDCKVGQILERRTRFSLTIRHVPKTLKNFKLKF